MSAPGSGATSNASPTGPGSTAPASSLQSPVPREALPLPWRLRLAWPKTLPEQVQAVLDVVAASPVPLDTAAVAARFTRPGKPALVAVLATLERLGAIHASEDGYYR